MRMTYRQLLKVMSNFSEDQLDSNVTIENALSEECYPSFIAITGESSDNGLETNHPVLIYDDSERTEDWTRPNDKQLDEYIESIWDDLGFAPLGP